MKRLLIILALLPVFAFAQFDGQDTLHAVNFKATGLFNIADVYHCAGGFQDSAATVSISVQDDWYQVTNAANNLFTGLECDGFSISGDTLIINNVGHYIAHITLSFNGTTNQEYHLRIWDVNGSAMEGFVITDSGRGATNDSQFSAPIYLVAETDADRFVMQVSNNSGTGDATFTHANFVVTYLHD